MHDSCHNCRLQLTSQSKLSYRKLTLISFRSGNNPNTYAPKREHLRCNSEQIWKPEMNRGNLNRAFAISETRETKIEKTRTAFPKQQYITGCRWRTSLPASLPLAIWASNSSLVWHAITAPCAAAIPLPLFFRSPLPAPRWDQKLASDAD